MTFFENSHEQVNGDGDPHLDTHGVLRCAVEGFDSQMLFDPFEEEFDVPAAAVKLGDLQRQSRFSLASSKVLQATQWRRALW